MCGYFKITGEPMSGYTGGPGGILFAPFGLFFHHLNMNNTTKIRGKICPNIFPQIAPSMIASKKTTEMLFLWPIAKQARANWQMLHTKRTKNTAN